MHTFHKRILTAGVLSVSTWTISSAIAQAPEPQVVTVERGHDATTTTTTTKPPLPSTTLPDVSGVDFVALGAQQAQESAEEAQALYGKCGEWHDTALSVGWPEAEWPTLSRVMFRESRCSTDAHNKTDPISGSRGLLQINGYWCRPSRYSQNGWLQDKGILSNCDDLFEPVTNLKAGLAIWLYGEHKHGCGWRGPWATNCQ